MNFDNSKQRKTVKLLAKRLAQSPMYSQQLRSFLDNQSPYADNRSYDTVINKIKSDSKIPIKKKGSQFIRTDIEYEV